MEQKENKYFIIGYGMGGGFGGIQNYKVVIADDIQMANNEAYEAAKEEYESHEGTNGIRSQSEIMEEDGLDEEEAECQYNEEIDSWIEYTAVEYSKEAEEKCLGYHYENKYKHILG